MNKLRHSGILLHPSSLPGDYGIGTLGKNAQQWIDDLQKAKQKWWQILPLGHTGFGDSPYQCFSSFAGNPLLIDFERLMDWGLLMQRDFDDCRIKEPLGRVDFHNVISKKYPVLQLAYKRFLKHNPSDIKHDFNVFCEQNAYWLDDYALFLEIKHFHNNLPWHQWNEPFKKREESAIKAFHERFSVETGFHRFCQWVFFRQWRDIKKYANERGIEIIGDIPLYVAHDSADAWAMPHLFQLDKNLNPKVVAGVPPDYFSATGQLWGNPIYDWKQHQKEGFQWWIRRFEASLELFDRIRIDHFRGFAAYWAVPYSDETAINGKWIPAPGKALFKTLTKHFGHLNIIAEDLGVITPDVIQLRDEFALPGMKILQYAFDSDDNENMPHNFTQSAVVYTGTHDNETTQGWYENLNAEAKNRLHTYLQSDGNDIHWKLIRLAFASVADFAIIPMQDILGLNNNARMNVPGTIGNYNWQWRLQKNQIHEDTWHVLRFLTELFGRE